MTTDIDDLKNFIAYYKEQVYFAEAAKRTAEEKLSHNQANLAEAESRLWIAERGITKKDIGLIDDMQSQYSIGFSGVVWQRDRKDRSWQPTPAKYEHVPEASQ